MDDFGHLNNNQKFSIERLEQIISLNKTAIEEGIHENEYELDEELTKQLQKSQQEANHSDYTKNNESNLKQNEIKTRKQ